MVTFFQAFACLSFLVLMYIIHRLYLAIRILNARVSILSTLIKNMRREYEQVDGPRSAEFAQMIETFSEVDGRLHRELSRDFSYADHTALLSLYDVGTGKDGAQNLHFVVSSDLSYIGTGSQKESVPNSLPATVEEKKVKEKKVKEKKAEEKKP